MKKNKAMRLASALLVLTLLTTCAISSTFAKYVTKAEGKDTARVAKFGVTVTAIDNAFSTVYDSENSATVKSSNEENVVAPGTKGSFAPATVTGQPEVSVKVTNEGTVELGDNWIVDGEYYCPLEVTVGNTTLKGTTFANVGAFENAIKEAIDGTTKTYAPGTDISGNESTPAISWEWAFERNDDAKDTVLGNAANATISITVTTTVTQVD